MGKTVENYLILQPLGQGNFAKVYKAKNIKTGQDFAIKVISAQKFKDTPKLEQCTVNQINILSQIRNESDYIVNYIDMLKTANNFYFVYEYCNGGTLDKLIQKQGYFPEKKACKILFQILQGFKVLNKHNIMHRDLKPENILIHNGNIKIADLSFCKLLENKDELTQTMLGSPIYMAPQVLRGQIYTMKADIWSIGIVFYKMLFGKCPYQSKSIALLIKLLQKQDLQFPIQPKISACTQQFLRRVLVKDPNQRINWDQIFSTFHITQSGQIINKKDQLMQQQQTQLRKSFKNNINQNGSFSFNNIRIAYPLNINGSPNPNYIPSPQINTSGGQTNSMNINQMNLISPKSNIVVQNQTRTLQSSYLHIKSPTIDKNLVPSKSPIKDHEQRNPNNFRTSGNNFNSSFHNAIVQNNSNISHNYRSISGNYDNPSNFSSQPNLGTNTQFTKTNTLINSNIDQTTSLATTQNKKQRLALSRIQILTKNHAKCIQINQIVLQILSLQQQYANYICYFVFKGICKQIEALYQNLRKQSITDQIYRQFRNIIQNQLNYINKIINNFYQTIQEDQKQNQLLTGNNNKNLDQQIFDNKQKILKLYIQNLNDSDQHIRLASQVVDYIEQNILIKRDAYQRMGRDHLYKQMRNKVFKE